MWKPSAAQFGQLALELARDRGWKFRFLVQSLSSCPTPTPEMLKAVVQVAYEIEREHDPHRAEQILANGISIKVRMDTPGVHAIKKQRLNGDKLTRVTGFEPVIGLMEGLQRTVRAYRSHYLNGAARKKA